METKLGSASGSVATEFRVAPLRDLCLADGGIQTGPFGSQLHKKDYTAHGTPIITVEHIGDNRIIHQDLPLVSEEDRVRLSRYTMRKGDIIFSRVGSVDRRALVRESENGWLFSGRCLRVRVDEQKISPEYLSWFFGLESFKEYIRRVAVGATMPSLNTKILQEIPVYLPSLAEQKRIAGILGALDDKIELNRKMNETLEQMAQALFKSWFVDFDPVHAKASGRQPAGIDKATADLFPDCFVDSELGKIPKGWRPLTISNCCERIFSGGTPNTSNRSFWDGEIPWLSSGETRESFIIETEKFITQAGVKNSSTRHARKGCTVIASAGQGHTRGQTSMLAGNFYINQSVIALECKIGTSTDLFNYFTMERRYEELRQLSDSNSSRGSLTTKLLAQIPVVLPPPLLLSAFDNFASPLVESIIQKASQTRSLSAIRDMLLPQLLAGSKDS